MGLDQEVRAILDAIDMPVFVLEPGAEGEPVYAAFNAAARRKARKTERQVLGRTARDVWGGELGDATYRWHVAVMEGAQAQVYLLDLPLGDEVTRVRTYLAPILDADGKPRWLVGTSEPGTRRDDSGTAATVLGLAAHALQGPLRNVRVLVDMAAEDTEAQVGDVADLLGTAAGLVQHAEAATRGVIDYARMTAVQEEITTFGLRALVAELLPLADPDRVADIEVQNADLTGDRTVTLIILRVLLSVALRDLAPGRRIAVTAAPALPGAFRVTLTHNGPPPKVEETTLLRKGTVAAGIGFALFGAFDLVQRRGGTLGAETDNDLQELSLTMPGTCSAPDGT